MGERLESDRLDSIRLFQDSVHWEGKVSTMLTRIYLCGFEVGKRCVVK